MKHIISHDVGEALAKSTAERALASYRERYPHAQIDAEWRDQCTAAIRLGVKGFQLQGTLSITATTICFELNVPLLLRPLQGKALSVLEREVQRWLEVARRDPNGVSVATG